MYVYEYAKMLNELQRTNVNVDSLKWMYFHGNESDYCVIESIFSGNDQQKVECFWNFLILLTFKMIKKTSL